MLIVNSMEKEVWKALTIYTKGISEMVSLMVKDSKEHKNFNIKEDSKMVKDREEEFLKWEAEKFMREILDREKYWVKRNRINQAHMSKISRFKVSKKITKHFLLYLHQDCSLNPLLLNFSFQALLLNLIKVQRALALTSQPDQVE